MITLFLLSLVVVGLVIAAMPVLAFALMLETCSERADTTHAQTASAASELRAGALRLVHAAE